MALRPLLVRSVIACLCVFGSARLSFGYSVVSHEAIIDAEWEDLIKPLLIAQFPNATPEQLHVALSYAYGGSVIQDMGYYPFGSPFFSHLTHYVRTGDFVQALFQESRDINDYAFALGALSHYAADIQGHSLAVNRSVPLLYPGLRKKYGNWMTWEDSPWAHALTEFGFDTLEVVAGHVAPQKYHDWIGFRVSKPVLERAFQRTYGLELSDETLNVDLSLAAYRKLASQFIPEMSEVAWALRRKQLEHLASGAEHRKLYHLSGKSYQAWLKFYAKPGLGDKFLAFIFRLIPKFGPLNAFDFHAPTLETERLFADSLKETVDKYQSEVESIRGIEVDPPNINLDTGRAIQPGEYRLGDGVHAKLLHKLERNHFEGVPPALRDDLLSFYRDSTDDTLRAKHRRWRMVLHDLDELRAMPPAATQAASGSDGPESIPPF